jgi:hypothetical protein
MKETLKLALETLESSRVFVMSREMIKKPEGADWYDNRITAIKEALQIASIIACRDALDAQPVPRRWVGLTNNELQPIADEYCILFGSWVEDFARAIEAKLREKNA